MFPIFNINNFKNYHRFQPPLTVNIPVDDTVKGGSAPEASTVKPETPEHQIKVIYEDLVKIGIIEPEEADESVSEDPAMLEPTAEAPYGYTASGRIRKRPLKSMQ